MAWLKANREFAVLIGLATAIALAFRTVGLGNTFQSSDNVELAMQCIENRGLAWVLSSRYGIMNPMTVKVFSAMATHLFHAPMNEFLFKLPVALMGTCQVPLTYSFVRRAGGSRMVGVFASFVMAIMPLHVMQSRYLWGYEVFGVFFLTLAIWKLLDFYENPNDSNAVGAGVFSCLYLVSHGYIVPFAACFVIIGLFFAKTQLFALWTRYKAVWIFPLIYLPMTFAVLEHTASRPTKLGFYLFDHAEGMLGNVGLFLTLTTFAGFLRFCFDRSIRNQPRIACLFGIGALYFAPLIFGAPPGIAVIRGYMLAGSCFLLMAGLLALDSWLVRRRTLSSTVLALVVALTAWGTYESIFLRESGFDPAFVKIERGAIPPDPGTKAMGYYVRKFVPSNSRILALHRAVEPPNLRYYLARESLAFYDLSFKQTLHKLRHHIEEADVIISEPGHRQYLGQYTFFELRAVVKSEGKERMLLYARTTLDLPREVLDSSEANRRFDKSFDIWAPY
jgi:hypothetical protein